MATWGDFSDNVVYVKGASVNIVWQAPQNIATSVTLYQANLTDGNVIGDFEYITKSVVNATEFQWRVITDKDLALSNVFLLSIYIEGGTVVEASSHYFNISSKSVDSTTTTGSSILSSTTSSSTTSSSVSVDVPTSTESSLSTSTSTDSTTTPSTASSNGVSKGAMIGMGVAIPCAIILGLAVGWFFFGRRRRRQQNGQNHAPGGDSSRDAMTSPEHSSMYAASQPSQHGQFYGAVPRESSPRAEMTGQTKPVELQQRLTDYEMSGEGRTAPHYELYAPGPDRPRMNSF
ncbi:hypothetical protein Daus18300_008657 [Diaporthe australafricana]|uniref:Mid2 domain-containing protein n=1 Tax=Diaporthe australafricana TaxID=127596 RepID=A0ABR3WH26_9PEZI